MGVHPAERPQFATRLGVVLTFVGVAVGLGNVWRFPYMVGAFGGGAFLFVYLIILGAFGIPAIMTELVLGRMTQRGTLGAFEAIGMPGGRVVGWTLAVTVFMAVSYYTVIVGWVLRYFLVSVTGEVTRIVPARFFDDVLGGAAGQFVMTAVVSGLAVSVLLLGIREGMERVSKVGMPLLFVTLLLLVARTLTLPGAGAGLRYYLFPDFSQINPGVIAAALGQVFFSLSLGGTFLVTYASYLPHHINLKRAAISIGIGETLAAVLAGLVIVPAAVSFGLELSSGPPLTFITAPTIFAAIPAGALFSALFFGLLFFAAFLSDVAAFEVLVTGAVDRLGWPRKRAALTVCGLALVVGVPSMMSLDYILTSDLFWGSIMQPVGSAMALLGVGWLVGRARALEEANRGNDGVAVGRLWLCWIKFVVPAGILTILTLGAIDLFRRFW